MAADEPAQGAVPGDDVVVFDLAQAMRVVGDDREILREVIDVYLEDLSEMMKTLDAAFGKDDAESVELHAHSLKGASANVGGQRVRAVAYEIEKAGRAKDLDLARSHWEALEQEAERLSEHLKGLGPDDI